MSTLVILPIEAEFSANSRKLLAAAQQLHAPITVLIHDSMHQQEYTSALSAIADVSTIAVMAYPEDATVLSKYLATWVKEQDFDTLLAGDHHLAQATLPRVAALLDVGQVSNVCDILSNRTFIHPIYAGNALETVEVLDNLVIATVRCSAFPLAATQNDLQPEECVLPPLAADASTTLIEAVVSEKGRHDLATAKWVIGIGRGVESTSVYPELCELAEKAGFAIGGTRAVIDAELMTNDKQIGQTGKVIAPDVYIALGLSGAIQHLAGILSAKKIIAVNRDADAPIMAIADIALVGTVEEVMPQLKNALLS